MIDLWVIFALLAVGGKTAFYAVQNRVLDDNGASSLELGYISSVYGLLFFIPFTVYVLLTNPPTVSWHIYAVVAGIGGIELVGLWMYLHALSLCDMSIVSPLKRTKPMLVGLFEPLLFSVPFNPILLVGAVSTGLGGYVILLKDNSLLAPFKRLTEPGPALALGTAFVYALLSLGSRYGNTRLSPFIFGTIIFAVMSLGYRGILEYKGAAPRLKDHARREYLLIGGLGAFRSAMIWIAYSLAAATLVSMMSQLTIILDVLVGGTLLKEGSTKQRLIGAIMVLVGVAVALIV